MDKEELEFTIRKAQEEEWYDAMALAWTTFLKYEADDYSPAGVKSFREFITDNFLHKMFLNGNYQLFLAIQEEKIVGLITLRNGSHISLLFVDEKYHMQGIGRRLIDYLVQEVKKKEMRILTVNASPYGLGFYHKIGFKDSGAEMEKDGIRYTPMRLMLG